MQTLTEREKALLQKIIEDKENHMSPYACRNTNAVREHASKYDNDVLRTQFAMTYIRFYIALYIIGEMIRHKYFLSIETTI